MQLNLLFLPLLGGYVFYMRWHVTSFYAARCGNQRLLLNAAAYGLLLLVLARLLTMAAEGIRGWQAAAVEWAAYLYIGSVAVLLLALIWIYFESRGDKELRQELGSQKPYAGLLIAAIAGAGALSLLYHLPGNPITIGLSVLACFSLIWTFACFVTILLRFGMEDLDEHLQMQFRPRALLLRVGLLSVLTLQATLLLALNVDQTNRLWELFSPYADSGTPFLACMIGVVASFTLNLVVPFQVANARLHHNLRTNSLERLFYRAAIESSLVQVTLKDGKVYVGWVDRLPPNPGSTDAYLQFLPVMSGYRDSTTKKVVFNTHYDHIYANEELDLGDFMKVVPLANIDSAGNFREDIYLQFMQAEEPGVEISAAPLPSPDSPVPPATPPAVAA